MIFIDTGALVARYLQADQYHARAERVWKQIERLRTPVVTSNFVLDEVLTFLARRTGSAFAASRVRTIFESSAFEILRPDLSIETEALALFEKFADQSVSFTDAVSFALMRRRRIQRAFTFDRHFALAGFEVWP